MLRYKTETRPGLVALYDIRPGNGVGQFYNPGARTGRNICSAFTMYKNKTTPYGLSSEISAVHSQCMKIK